MRKIATHLDAVEIQGTQVKGLPLEADQVVISAHRIHNTLVIIGFHGQTVTVSVDELRRAITNAANH